MGAGWPDLPGRLSMRDDLRGDGFSRACECAMTVSGLDLPSLASAYEEGLSPVELVDIVFARIHAAQDPGIFISLDQEAARAAARALPADRTGLPLWGVPFAVKDNIDVAGFATTAACPGFSYKPEKDAFAVARLKAAGAIVIGKTNLDQFATGLVGVRSPYPIPRNAFDPAMVPGGSSSGSAVAVARDLVSFALGTDTAGSGRVPAGLNNIVGLKPTLGSVSTSGVVPACRTLDTVSVFAGSVDEAWTVYSAMAGFDPADGYSRSFATGPISVLPPHIRVGVPNAAGRRFGGDALAQKAYERTLELLTASGASLVELDFTPFFETAALLYDGPWVGERFAAVRAFMDGHAADMLEVTRKIIGQATRFSAADTFAAQYRLADLKRRAAAAMAGVDMLCVPTFPRPRSVADLVADPVGPNSELGTYTNFVNLLDLCALAVPGPFRDDGFPAGVTLIGRAGQDGGLASLGAKVHALSGVTRGASGQAVAPEPERLARAGAGEFELVAVGAHMSGMPLNRELTDLGARFLRKAGTAPDYRLFALPGGPPRRPGLLRIPKGTGHSIACEVWALPPAGFGAFVAEKVPAPLSIGTLHLADGTTPRGFLVESEAVVGAQDVSGFGGWRAYMASLA